eukprot:scaffold72915_cov69-Phaeocystis_antarctica.AAC.1
MSHAHQGRWQYQESQQSYGFTSATASARARSGAGLLHTLNILYGGITYNRPGRDLSPGLVTSSTSSAIRRPVQLLTRGEQFPTSIGDVPRGIGCVPSAEREHGHPQVRLRLHGQPGPADRREAAAARKGRVVARVSLQLPPD